MKTQLNVVPFPSGAESNGFIAALSSVVCCIKKFTDDTPYWCSPNGSYCKRCGSCSGQSAARHQESIYHTLLTASGLAFAFDYPEDDSVCCHTIPDTPIGWRWNEPFLADIMDFAGCSYKRYTDKNVKELRELITPMIDAGYPALAANDRTWTSVMSWASAWRIICGYTEKGILIMNYGGEIVEETEGDYEDIIIITGEVKTKQSYNDILKKIYKILTDSSHDILEKEIMQDLSNVTKENAANLAYKMMGINGVPIEARWHAAEAFASCDNLLSRLSDDKELKNRLADLFFSRYIANNNNETHGIGWKIWGCLNVGPNTGYMPTEESFRLIQNPSVQDELKRLFGIIFENDRFIAEKIGKIIKTKET